jgi:3-hydroxyisobutyrate dehydrogenase-like beta-hydroxyacid dehydrogenase
MDVGFIGLGIMGSRMAANLARAGHAVCAWTRTEGKAQAWADQHGATAAATPAEAAAAGDVVISMVVDGAQVQDVLLDREDAAVRGARAGALFVDMSTIAPPDARRIADRLASAGVRFLDAPVTGSSPKAQDGTLTIMVGGAAPDVERARPLFEAMGSLVVHVGETGQAQSLKLINNAVAAANTATLAQAILLADAAGVDLDAFEKVLGAGSGGSAMLALKAGPMRAHDYSTLFKAEHMLKDVSLCLEEARAAGSPFPAAASARDALIAVCGQGLGEADFVAMLAAYEGMTGKTLSG